MDTSQVWGLEGRGGGFRVSGGAGFGVFAAAMHFQAAFRKMGPAPFGKSCLLARF